MNHKTILSLLVVRSCASFAGVASVSNRVIAPKLERKQNKIKEGGGGGDKRFPFLPISSFFIPGLFFAPSQHFRRTHAETLATQVIWLFVFLSFFLSFFLSLFIYLFLSLFLSFFLFFNFSFTQ